MPNVPLPPSFPDTASLSALRAWYAGVGAREALERYCPQALEGGQSARGVIANPFAGLRVRGAQRNG